MRALTLIQPMSWAIVADKPNPKRVENRPRPLPKAMQGVETIVAVHAGKQWSDEYAAAVAKIFCMPLDAIPRVDGGGIVGVMKLSGHTFTDVMPPMSQYPPPIRGFYVNPWYAGPHGYEIVRAVALPEAIPCRGLQGFWPVPAEIEAHIVDSGVLDRL